MTVEAVGWAGCQGGSQGMVAAKVAVAAALATQVELVARKAALVVRLGLVMAPGEVVVDMAKVREAAVVEEVGVGKVACAAWVASQEGLEAVEAVGVS